MQSHWRQALQHYQHRQQQQCGWSASCQSNRRVRRTSEVWAAAGPQCCWARDATSATATQSPSEIHRAPRCDDASSHCLTDLAHVTHHIHNHLTAVCPGLRRWAGTKKAKPIWILLKQEMVSGSGISWATCKQSAPRSRQITTPALHHSGFYRLDALPDAQRTVTKHWRQNTSPIDSIKFNTHIYIACTLHVVSCRVKSEVWVVARWLQSLPHI